MKDLIFSFVFNQIEKLLAKIVFLLRRIENSGKLFLHSNNLYTSFLQQLLTFVCEGMTGF